jgi:hypothetical protein
MARLIYSAITSLDGYVADEDGNFDWAAPDEEVHAYVNDLERPIGVYLYGRRLYEVMVAWENPHTVVDLTPVGQDFARIWQTADKMTPIVVGGGHRALPHGVRLKLELLDERRFRSGIAHLHDRTRS